MSNPGEELLPAVGKNYVLQFVSRFHDLDSIFLDFEDDITIKLIKVVELEEQSNTEEEEEEEDNDSLKNYIDLTLQKTITSIGYRASEILRNRKKKKRATSTEVYFNGLEKKTHNNGYSPIHVAAATGHVEAVRALIKADKFVCMRLDKHGATPLHEAASRGHVEVMKVILDACPEAMKVVTPSGQNCLHTAVLHNRERAVQFLVEWMFAKQNNRGLVTDLINGKDYGGNTPLHLAVSRKQFQTLQLLLTCKFSLSKLVDVNAMTSDGFTALDILNVLPCSGKLYNEMENLLHQAGALRARDIVSRNISQYTAAHDDKRNWFTTSNMSTKMRTQFSNHVLLLISSLLVAISYQAAFNTPGRKQQTNQVQTITRSFILFNSTGFVGSLAVVIFLLNEFPFKPWPQISASMLFGSYMCCIMSFAPNEARILLLLAIPVLLLATAGKQLFGLG